MQMYQVNFNTGKIFLILFFGVFGISTAAIFVKLATETTGLDGIGFSLFLAASRLIISPQRKILILVQPKLDRL